MKLVYFAWVREGLGRSEDEVEPPAEVASVADLLAWLRTRGEAEARTLADTDRLRFAVNQTHAGLDHPVTAADEVAIFPPVTGG